MKPPIPTKVYRYAVAWINAGNHETMYSGAMTKEAAEYLVAHGNWHSKAAPSVVELEKRKYAL